MNRCLDCIQIWCGGYLGIADDLINFWNESIKNKMAAAAIPVANRPDTVSRGGWH